MTPVAHPAPVDDEVFAGRAGHRIRRLFFIIAIAATAMLLAWRQWLPAGGFAVGAFVAYIALLQLEIAASEFAAQAAGENTGGGAGLRFLLRYAAVVVIGYVIFLGSRSMFYGFVGALFVPVAAMMGEAAYEAWTAMRRSF